MPRVRSKEGPTYLPFAEDLEHHSRVAEHESIVTFSADLKNLYIMLGVMNSIHNAALYGADDDDDEEELTDAELN